MFNTLKEARVVIEGWRRHYNIVRPHSALGWKPPTPDSDRPPTRHTITIKLDRSGRADHLHLDGRYMTRRFTGGYRRHF